MTSARIDDLRKRLDKEPGSRLFAQLAEELRKEGELLEAIRVARDGLQKHPAYPSARMTLGRALLDKGDLAPARSEFESVLKGAPDNILASRFLGECLEGLGDLEGAAARYKATLLLSPDDRQVVSRLEGVQEKIRRRSVRGGGPDDSRPVPVAEVDEPMVLELAHEGRALLTGDVSSSVKGPADSGVTALEEESFEVERPYEPPPPQPAWQAPAYAPSNEVVFEESPDTSTIPPMRPPLPFVEAIAAPERTIEVPTSLATPFSRPEPILEVEPMVEPEPEVVPEPSAAEPEPEQPPLASPTLAELYFNQGFTDKAAEVYRQILERDPGNERVRARLAEVLALDRHLRGEPKEAPPVSPPASPMPDARARRRQAIERTIARLESLLVAVRRE